MLFTGSTRRIGDIFELDSKSWLFKQDYDVFENISAVGPIDLIAYDWRHDRLLLIDCKLNQVNPKAGSRTVYAGLNLYILDKRTGEFRLREIKCENGVYEGKGKPLISLEEGLELEDKGAKND